MMLKKRIQRSAARTCAVMAAATFALVGMACATASAQINGNEWSSWRGPDNSGASRATGLISSWATEDENLLWKAPIGGRSTPIIMNGRVFVLHLTGDKETWQEEVVGLDAHTGEILWRDAFPLFHTDIPSDRVGWSSPVGDPETGYVYTQGVQGIFTCHDFDGNIVWRKSLTEQFGRISGYGGRTHTPFLDGDKVIVGFMNSGLGAQGRGMHRFLAMDKRTGEIIWWATPGKGPLDTTFSVPTVAMINGVRQIIAGNSDGWVYGMNAETGDMIWEFQLSKRGINTSVIVDGTKVYVSHSEDNIDNTTMGRLVCIDATGTGNVTETHEIWRADGVRAGYASSVLAEGRIYSLDNSCNIICNDAETGEEYWRLNTGKVGWGSPIWADGKLYSPTSEGTFQIIEPGDREAKILSDIDLPPHNGAEPDIRGCPAVAYGRVYVLSRQFLYCLGSGDSKGMDIAIPGLPDDGPATLEVASAHVIPGEIHLEPGESVDYRVRLYDAQGRVIDPSKLDDYSLKSNWEFAGPRGDILTRVGGDNGNELGATFTPDAALNGQFGVMNLTLNAGGKEIKTSARVRVKTALPIEEDFEGIAEGANPNHWIGASSVKFDTVVEDGNHIWRKEAERAQFRRALVYMGPPEMSNYTVQADVRGSEQRRSLPDMGLINNRYEFQIKGNNEELRIVSWVPMPRVVATIPFMMDPDVWYTMKCRVDYEGDKGIVRGKVWVRGEEEPEAWTIELEDPLPNRNGSPGLACFSMAEVFYDNIKVTANN